MRISKLLFILVTSLPFFADAQISISGIVKDLNDKSIKYANVVLTDSDGFIVVVTGQIMTMPGLPKVPSANSIMLDEKGLIQGLF